MTPLERWPEVREYLYLIQWVVNLVLGGVAVVLTILGESPLWYVIVSAVFNFFWTYTGITARGNVTYSEEGDDGSDAGGELAG